MTDHARVSLAAAVAGVLVSVLAVALSPITALAAEPQPFLPQIAITSTIPANGDLNPYGVAFVPADFPAGGRLTPGDILVSNFNNLNNTQGAGTTIIKFTPDDNIAAGVPTGQPGNATTFFQGPTGLGLTTALTVLSRGFVLVGNVPTTPGPSGSLAILPGSLLVIDRHGRQLTALTNQLNDPWDLAIDDEFDHATVFVSNVNNNTTAQKNGTVTRLTLSISDTALTVTSATVIANRYTVEPNAAALVLGPTGLAYDVSTDTLYVASTADNAIYAVPSAGSRTGPPLGGTGTVIFRDAQLRGPLALVLAPNGDLVTSNGDAVNVDPSQPSEIVEITPQGQFVRQFNVDTGQGGAFGIGIAQINGATARLAVVDDNANDMIVIDTPTPAPVPANN
jgi:hypothetical protein